LAWVRTSISVMSLGFVVAKFGVWLRELAPRLPGTVHSEASGWSGPVGMGMIAFGGALALLAAWRFHVVNRQIKLGKVQVDRGLVGLVAIAMMALAVLLITYVAMTTVERAG
jgi:putative membrane protein